MKATSTNGAAITASSTNAHGIVATSTGAFGVGVSGTGTRSGVEASGGLYGVAAGTVTGRAVFANATGTGDGLYATSADGFALRARCYNAGTSAVDAQNENGTGMSATSNLGVAITATSTQAVAVTASSGATSAITGDTAANVGAIVGRNSNTGTANVQAYGVHGTTTAMTGGVVGQNFSTTYNINSAGVVGTSEMGAGVYAYAKNNVGIAAYAEAASAIEATSPYVGVSGHCTNPDILCAGVYGLGAGGASKGVWGDSGVAAGGVGVKATASTPSALALSVVGDSILRGKLTTIIGDVWVVGDVLKSSGSFKIDHPLDPEHKWLSHSFVESPDMMNVYNGNVTLDANGEAKVRLPDYFHALNRDFRYQLTPIGAHQPLFIKTEISDGAFTIGGGAPGGKVSWQVTGIRQDDYAKEHPIVVEQDKQGEDVGTRAFVPKGSSARSMHAREKELERPTASDLSRPAILDGAQR